MLVIEDGTEDTLSTENVVSMQLLVCLDAIEDTTKTTNAKERIKKNTSKMPHNCTIWCWKL